MSRVSWSVLTLSALLLPNLANAVCGDAIVEAAEECDDGNLVDGDLCSASCFFEAGALDA